MHKKVITETGETTWADSTTHYLNILDTMRSPDVSTAEEAEAINFAISCIKTLHDMGVIK